jgi:ubiquinone/menaquinone biosynthesis C-methylase UbiE
MTASPPTLDERVERERAAHTEDDVLGRSAELKDRFAHIWRYPALRRLLARLDAHLDAADGARVLDLGCGRGERSVDLLRRGATVDGIDISSVYTAQAEATAHEAGFDADRFTFVAGDAHCLPYDDATFDLVVGDGILHHLDLDVALGEIHRVLKPGGRALFREPLLDNPLLKLFRRLTPKARTEDELPLSASDLRQIAGSDRWRVESTYCGLLSAPVAVVTSFVLRPWPNNVFLRAADRLEQALDGRRTLEPMHQYVLLDLVRR